MIGQVGENSIIVVIKEAVAVKVPTGGKFVGEVRRDDNGKSVVIPEHYHDAFPIGRVMFNRNFYGMTRADLGRRITTTVQVFKKTVAGGKKYTAVDFFRVNGTRPVCEFKINDQKTENAVPILGTDQFINFKPL